MKKAQILSAIALAFALGVVAPIAGVYAADGASTRVGSLGTVETTKSDVNTAIAKAEAVENYGKFLNLYNAVQATVKDGTDVVLPTAKSVTDLITAINDKYAPADDITLQGAVNAANDTNVPNYSNWNEIVGLMTKDAGVAENTQRDNLITAVQKVFPTYSAGADATYDSVVTDITTNVAAIKAQYDKYSPLITAVASANAAMKVEGNLRAALIAVGESADRVNGLTAIADLKTQATGYPKYTTYASLIEAVAEAKKDVAANTTADFATDITDINTPYKTLTGKDLADVAAPTDPVDPEKPGEGDDNNQNGEGDGKGDGATTPDTGVIANSEATATSTASIMAGIATALTAAGVGVVAFRNIRRNKKA